MAYQSEIEKLQRRYDEKPEQWFAALADAHRKVGELDRAIRIVQAGIQQRPNYVSGHIVLGRCLVDQGADDEAEKVFEEVLELDAENIIALKVLGDVSERRGNREAARRWLGRLLEVDPMNDEARMMLDRVSQPEPAPEVEEPAASESPLITESAARTAGVASKKAIPDEVDTAPIVEAVVEDPASPNEDLLDIAPRIETPRFPSVENTPTPTAGSAFDEPAEIEAPEENFVIERTSEAMEVVEDEPNAPNPFAAIEEAETKMVSFDDNEENPEPIPLADADTGELAAGTLDFVPNSTEPATSDPHEPVSEPEADAAESAAESIFSELTSKPLFESAPLFTPSAETDDDQAEETVAPPEAAADPELWNMPVGEPERDPDPVTEEVTGSMDEVKAPDDEPGGEVEQDEALEAVAELMEAEPVFEPDAEAQSEPEDEPEPEAEVGAFGSQRAPVGTHEEGTPPSVMTETMAEVYASQGLFDQARDVYRQLLSDSPGDPSLQSKLAALEERARAVRSSPGDNATRSFAAEDTGGVSVRTMLTSLLTTRPGDRDDRSDDDVVFVTPSEPTPLEQAFGDGGFSGDSAKPAADEPSLASLFGDDDSGRDESDSSAERDDASALTYDGFYGSDPTPASKEPAEAEDDEEFKAWLRSLRS